LGSAGSENSLTLALLRQLEQTPKANYGDNPFFTGFKAGRKFLV
jgi:hypothetical protein